MTRKKVAEGHAAVNRCYKDTVFRMLFADKENLLSLYNAMNGKSYTNPDEQEIVTLENAIYMEMKNDLAFIIDTSLYLYEHQSTFNPNIPLRDLLYISCEYQRSCVKKSLSWAKKKDEKILFSNFPNYFAWISYRNGVRRNVMNDYLRNNM